MPRRSGQTLAATAYYRMREDILSCAFGPQQQAADEQAARRVYRFSLSPLREALARLHAEGLVCSSDHRSYAV